jgi:hypothetical protein
MTTTTTTGPAAASTTPADPSSARATALIEALVVSTRGARGALLASVDGRPLAASLPDHDPRSTAAIIASSRGLGERLADLSGAGTMQEIVVRSTSGYVVIYTAGARGVLTVLTDSSVNLAMLHLKARDVAARVAEELEPAADQPS